MYSSDPSFILGPICHSLLTTCSPEVHKGQTHRLLRQENKRTKVKTAAPDQLLDTSPDLLPLTTGNSASARSMPSPFHSSRLEGAPPVC